jgi:hypothetical protein
VEFLSAESFPDSFLFCFPSLAHHINGSHLLLKTQISAFDESDMEF